MDSNRGREFLSGWLVAAVAIGAICLVVGSLAAPMLLPVLLGETWWSFVLMGLAYFFIISFLAALGEWL